MNEQESIESVAASICQMFAEQARTILASFTEERRASQDRYRHLVETSEVRLVNANKMVEKFSQSADHLSDLQRQISTTYTEQIERLSSRCDELSKVVAEQQAYIRILQDKVDDRDAHIRDLQEANKQKDATIATLIDRSLHAQPLMANNFAPTR